MAHTLNPVSRKALAQSPQQRMGLAALLVDSLVDDTELDAHLLPNLSKRADELRNGTVKGLTTEEAYGFSL